MVNPNITPNTIEVKGATRNAIFDIFSDFSAARASAWALSRFALLRILYVTSKQR